VDFYDLYHLINTDYAINILGLKDTSHHKFEETITTKNNNMVNHVIYGDWE